MTSVTPNGIQTIVRMTNPASNPNQAPILVQIISIKSVGTNDNGAQRYRTVLSDGQNFVQGMIATQLNGLVERKELQVNSIVQLQDFMNNSIQGKHVIILLRIAIVSNPGHRIGSPTDIEKALNGAPQAQPQPQPSAGPMYNRTNMATSNNNNDNRMTSMSPVKSNPYGSMNKSGIVGVGNYSNPYGGLKTPTAPVVRSMTTQGGTPITLISQLNMYQNRWTIKARVVAKSDIKTWSNAKGEGSLFEMELLDSSGVDIRCTMFKKAVDKFYNQLVVGQVYSISGGKLKVANVQYNKCKSPLEMTLDENGEIRLENDSNEIQAQMFDFVKIASIEQIEAGKFVDVLGVIQEIGGVNSVTSRKTGQELQKCDITLVDDSQAEIRLTLWGSQATNADQEMSMNDIVAFRRARVSDYAGKCLSGGNGIFVRPQVPEAQALQQWWETQGKANASNIKSLSGQSGMGGKMDPFSERKHVADIKGEGLGYSSEKGDYLCFKGHFSFLRKDKEGGAWYTACPNKEEPCRSRCKVTQTTDGNWQCDRCQGTYPNCTRRWIFSGTVADDTGTTWVSVFDEQAVQLLDGATADDVFAQYDNQDYYNGLFAKALYSEWIFKCRVKNEMVNDEQRIKTQVVRMDPVDYVSESKELLTALQAFQ